MLPGSIEKWPRYLFTYLEFLLQLAKRELTVRTKTFASRGNPWWKSPVGCRGWMSGLRRRVKRVQNQERHTLLETSLAELWTKSGCAGRHTLQNRFGCAAATTELQSQFWVSLQIHINHKNDVSQDLLRNHCTLILCIAQHQCQLWKLTDNFRNSHCSINQKVNCTLLPAWGCKIVNAF